MPRLKIVSDRRISRGVSAVRQPGRRSNSGFVDRRRHPSSRTKSDGIGSQETRPRTPGRRTGHLRSLPADSAGQKTLSILKF